MLGILNSKLVFSWMQAIAPEARGGYKRFKKVFVERIPIPVCIPEQRAQIESLVQQILDLKAADPDADVSSLENEIDRLVEKLYFGEVASEAATTAVKNVNR